MVFRFAIFLAVVTLLLVLLNLHFARWAADAMKFSPRGRRFMRWSLLGSVALMVGGRASKVFFDSDALHWLGTVGSTVQLVVMIAVVLLFPADVFIGLHKVVAWVRQRTATDESEAVDGAPPAGPPVTTRDDPKSAGEAALAPQPLSPYASRNAIDLVPRRSFLGQAAFGSSFLIASSSSLYGVLAGRHDYQIEEVEVRLDGLPRSLDGFTIVQLSDIHIGEYVGAPELAAAHDLVRQARPDLIVLTGDLLDRDPARAPELGAFVHKLGPLAREGVVAISGNHDFYAGIDPTCDSLRQGGARVLRNDGCVIGDAGGSFALLGVDDVMGPRFGGRGADLARAQRRLPESRDLPSVLLCHNPQYFQEAQGQVGLQLSGHTHGGQINLVVSPASLVLRHGFIAGRYERKGSQLYVNRGFGTVGPPARIGASPEISRIVLRG